MDQSKFPEWWAAEWMGEPNEQVRRIAAFAYSAGGTQAAEDIITLIMEWEGAWSVLDFRDAIKEKFGIEWPVSGRKV